MDNYSEGLATGMALNQPSNHNGYNNGFGGWGGGLEGIIALVVVAAIFGGGNGLFGNNRGNAATQADLSAGFSTSEIMSDLNSIILGQAQMQNYINQGFSGLQNSLCQSFGNVDNAICTLGYQNQAGFNALSSQIASCCCDLKTMNLENRYLNEKQTCDIQTAIANSTRDIVDSQRCGTDKILNFLTNEKISSLQSENAGLKAQISNDRQSAYITDTILDKLSPCPKPAYLTCNPNAPYGLGYGFPIGGGYNHNGGCCGASVL